jgi:uncharacterized protein with GYD domain
MGGYHQDSRFLKGEKMDTFIMLSRLATGALASPKALEDLETRIVARIKSECPDVTWLHNFAVLGPYDYLDVFTAPDIQTAFKASTIVRTLGHAKTEVWCATEWAHFKDMIRELPAGP